MGTMISRSNSEYYYYHHQRWYDVNNVRHCSGYYGADGYYYQSAAEIGYAPPPDAPAAECCTNCQSSLWWILGTLFCCCCGGGMIWCFVMRKPKQNVQNVPNEYHDNSESQLAESFTGGDVVTREGQTISRADAVGFIQALEAEYVDGAEGEIGQLFDSRGFLEEVTRALACEEAAIRDSQDRQGAVFGLADRWHMRDMLNHS